MDSFWLTYNIFTYIDCHWHNKPLFTVGLTACRLQGICFWFFSLTVSVASQKKRAFLLDFLFLISIYVYMDKKNGCFSLSFLNCWGCCTSFPHLAYFFYMESFVASFLFRVLPWKQLRLGMVHVVFRLFTFLRV